MLNRFFRAFFKQSIETKASIKQQKLYTQQTKLAEQIAHDLASPLAALRSVLSISKELPEQQRRLIEISVDRIEEIVSRIREHNEL